MAHFDEAHPVGEGERSGPLALAIHLLGAVTSLALVVGVGVWGYRMVVRDVSGVPVVRAAQGPMRVQPADPGGSQAPHQGLAVNAIAARGSADAPSDRVILAPEPLRLALDDIQVVPLEASAPASARSTAGRTDRTADAAPAETSHRLEAVTALAESLAEGVEPLAPVAGAERGASSAPQPQARHELALRVEGGLGRSLRPRLRPGGLGTSPDAVTMASVDAAALREVDPDTIPIGTRLAQLGAFASREIALREWSRLSERFGDFLADKGRVIQEATSGGRTFWRLRAMGFDDLSDARRFCSALVAEGADCIPVVAR